MVEAGERLAESLELEDVINAAVRSIVPAFADFCAIDLGDHPETSRRAATRFADTRQWQRLDALVSGAGGPAERGLIAEAIGSRRPVRIEPLRPDVPWGEAGLRALLALPLVSGERVIGALTMGTAEGGGWLADGQVELVEYLGRRIALAVDAATAHARLARLARHREHLLTMVAHDMRQPLSVIFMKLNRLLREPAPGGDRRRVSENLDELRLAAERLHRLLAGVLDAASLEAGELKLVRRPHRVLSLVDEAAQLLGPLAAERDQRVEVDVPPELEASCDGERVLQVLSNLLGNAVKYAGDGARIDVRAWTDGGEVQVAVVDDGAGIPAGELPYVFDRHFQGRRLDRQGHGLGLAIVKDLVQAHGGRIWAESAPGAGATFRFTLPLARPQQSPTVLVVDDDELLCTTVSAILNTHGYRAAVAHDGAAALAYLEREPAPVRVLLDLAMPGMDGWQFLERRAARPAVRAVPVTVMTGQKAVVERLRASGADVLPKPVGERELMERLAG